MGLRGEVKRLERAAGVNEPCPMCALGVPDDGRTDSVEGVCPICGASVRYNVTDMTPRQREVGAELALVTGENLITDQRRLAMVIWFHRQRNIREGDERETQVLERRAPFDPEARLRLKWKRAAEDHAIAACDAMLGTATDEQLEDLARICQMSDMELEVIIWPAEKAA